MTASDYPRYRFRCNDRTFAEGIVLPFVEVLLALLAKLVKTQGKLDHAESVASNAILQVNAYKKFEELITTLSAANHISEAGKAELRAFYGPDPSAVRQEDQPSTPDDKAGGDFEI